MIELFKRNAIFSGVVGGLLLVNHLSFLILSIVKNKYDYFFLSSLISSLVVLLLFTFFVSEVSRKRFYVKDEQSVKDKRSVLLIFLIFELIILAIAIVLSLTIR